MKYFVSVSNNQILGSIDFNTDSLEAEELGTLLEELTPPGCSIVDGPDFIPVERLYFDGAAVVQRSASPVKLDPDG